ncbi:hypothetical protein FACS1894133_1730 [Clostridia bacterium]|nr:hypothetical protein FACS1894133_1730 [Clostridia bacterium]
MISEHNRLVLCDWNENSFCLTSNIGYSNGLLTSKNAVYSKSYAFFRVVDSGEQGYRWGRVSLDCTLPPNAVINTYARCSDKLGFGIYSKFDDCLADFNECLTDFDEDYISELIDDEESVFRPIGGSDDFYVNLVGRYIWFCFELISSESSPVLNAVHIHMGGDHMIDYMPAVYQKDDDFTRRFLSVFDSIFMDMEQRIDELPLRFDFENADSDMLRYLSDWVCADSDYDDNVLTEHIKSAVGDYDDMYTVRGIKRSVKRLTGYEPFVIESINVDPNDSECVDSELYRRLYGWNPFRFFIMLDENCFNKRSDMEHFLTKMRTLIPAHTEFELILLKRSVQLDCHSYLSVNSFVGSYVPAVIDENTSIYYDTTIGGNTA